MLYYYTFIHPDSSKSPLYVKTYMICPKCGKKIWMTAVKYYLTSCPACLTPIKKVYDIVAGKAEERIKYYLGANLT